MIKVNIPGTILCFNKDNFHGLCNKVAESDPGLKSISQTYSYLPLWTRSNTFATLIHIILEQQVSLASAKQRNNKSPNTGLQWIIDTITLRILPG